uniref:Ribonuclease T n=1 Tax=Candidatus Kentrum sp. TUN TaxID=2126343 RepID=A0A450ZNN1_9GAMM|nr:MAG: ribonuclease T [Candidatus Kentron sp. TUN]
MTDTTIANRFRGYLPVVIDVETGGFNPQTDALLEVAAVILDVDKVGHWHAEKTHFVHITPFPDANIETSALAFNHIDPFHPLRAAMPEHKALQEILKPIRLAVKKYACTRAVLVGHNPAFDLAFINAALKRNNIKRNPFHPFTTFDTATLGGLAVGQTVLARAVESMGFSWDSNQAHTAIYDAEKTAELFCTIVNQWGKMASMVGQ